MSSADTGATVMASLAPVDLVVLFDEETPFELIQALRPDVLVKGADYRPEQVVDTCSFDRRHRHRARMQIREPRRLRSPVGLVDDE